MTSTTDRALRSSPHRCGMWNRVESRERTPIARKNSRAHDVVGTSVADRAPLRFFLFFSRFLLNSRSSPWYKLAVARRRGRRRAARNVASHRTRRRRRSLRTGVGRGGKTPRDREVEEPRRVGSRKRQADSAATQDSGAPRDVRSRGQRGKRTRGWPGIKTVSQGGGGEDPRGEPCGSRVRSLRDLAHLRPGIEALKRRAFEPKRRAGAKPQEGMGRGTGTDPGEVTLREGNLASAAGHWIRRQGRAGSKPSSGTNPGDGGIRDARPEADRLGLKRCGDDEPQESHRGRTQPARRPTVQTRKTSPRPRRRRGRGSGLDHRQAG